MWTWLSYLLCLPNNRGKTKKAARRAAFFAVTMCTYLFGQFSRYVSLIIKARTDDFI